MPPSRKGFSAGRIYYCDGQWWATFEFMRDVAQVTRDIGFFRLFLFCSVGKGVYLIFDVTVEGSEIFSCRLPTPQRRQVEGGP